MINEPPPPSWRKPAGVLAILGLIMIWCVVIAGAAPTVGGWHWTLQLGFYLVTGIIWIMPMKPLLRWMELGRWT